MLLFNHWHGKEKQKGGANKVNVNLIGLFVEIGFVEASLFIK